MDNKDNNFMFLLPTDNDESSCSNESYSSFSDAPPSYSNSISLTQNGLEGADILRNIMLILPKQQHPILQETQQQLPPETMQLMPP